VIFDPLPIPNTRNAELRIPDSVDIMDPYALWSLYWPESMWDIISRNTNLYAIHRITIEKDDHKRPWWDTSTVEIKVFVGMLIYMGMHESPSVEDY
jgi:hypothetical protein